MAMHQIDPARRDNLYTAVQFLVETFGIEYNEDNCEHLLTFMEALATYHQRTQEYGDLWKEAGAVHAFYDGMRKARRVSKVWTLGSTQEEADKFLTEQAGKLDDAFDTVNYMLFGIRNARSFRFVEVFDDSGDSFFGEPGS